MRLPLIFPLLFGFAIFGCGSYDTGFDKVKQGVIIYPATEFWANDTTNLFVNGPMDSVKLLLKHDEHRKLPGIAWLSALITVGAIYAQTVPQFPHYYIDAWLFYPICYFTTFVMFTTLLVALTFSWYNEEILKATIDRFAEIQEQMLSDDATSIQKRDFLLKTIAEGELDVVFTGLDCSRIGMESVHRTELILLRSRYFSARKLFHTGEIAHPDYRIERSATTKGLEHLIRAIFPN